ncbi:MAG: hypothetical protein PVG87_27280, partial [Desulfobacteraceae bacterium]
PLQGLKQDICAIFFLSLQNLRNSQTTIYRVDFWVKIQYVAAKLDFIILRLSSARYRLAE